MADNLALGMSDLLKPGQIFVGRYKIERALAQGGMGAVFVAEQIATELTVAIKVLFPHILASKDSVEKFQFEAKVAARVKSDHIVKVLDAGYDDESGLPFLVMELLRGKELDSIVESEGPLSLLDTAEYLRQVASGLDKAHSYVTKDGAKEPIVHRDLKPENIFLERRESGEPIVKILDFGIAKVLSDTANVSQEIKGTPLYMAFEQATGKALSPQTDIWALGLIAFYLLTGKIYWNAASNPNADVSSLFAEVLTLSIDPPSQRIVELGGVAPWPEGFDRWFARCVDRDPSARFATAGEAAQALARALGVADRLGPTSSQASFPSPSRASSAQALDATIAGSTHLGATLPETKPDELKLHTNAGPGTPKGMATEGQMALSHTSHESAPTKHSSSTGRSLIAAAAILATGGIAAAFALSRGNTQEEEVTTSAASGVQPAVTPPQAEPEPEAKIVAAPTPPPEPEKSEPEPEVKKAVPPLVHSPKRRAPRATTPPKSIASPRKPAPSPQPVNDPYGER